MSRLRTIQPEYVYVTIPAEYICVYHRLLAMMADYGEDMLKDCKASCTERNSNVIECFNMFNAAVAARKLGQGDANSRYTKLAATLIKYIKAKIKQIYHNKDNSTSFTFPIDENGELKAFVSCGEMPTFKIDEEDGNLYEHKFGNGYDSHLHMSPEEESQDAQTEDHASQSVYNRDRQYYAGNLSTGLCIKFIPRFELGTDNNMHPCGDLLAWYDGQPIDINNAAVSYYFEDEEVNPLNSVILGTQSSDYRVYNFMVVVTYNGETQIVNVNKEYEASN